MNSSWLSVLDLLARRLDAEECFRERAHFRLAAKRGLEALRPLVDLESWTVASVEILRADVEQQTVQRNAPTHRERRVGGPLARILLIPDDLLGDFAADPARADPEPQLCLRDDRQGEILFGVIFLGLVEYVRVDAEIRELDRGAEPQRPEPNPHRGGIGTAGLIGLRGGRRRQKHTYGRGRERVSIQMSLSATRVDHAIERLAAGGAQECRRSCAMRSARIFRYRLVR